MRIGLAALAACRGTATVTPRATVFFTLDAPLCSSRIPVQFSIDSVQVGTDTFLVHLAVEHTTSRGYAVPAGQHVLSARVVSGYVWADKRVTLAPGAAFTDSLPFYCS